MGREATWWMIGCGLVVAMATACPGPRGPDAGPGDGDGDGDGDAGAEDAGDNDGGPDGGGALDAGGGDGGAAGDAGPGDAGMDLTALVFDPDHVLQVEVTLDPDDWAALKAQTRTFVDILAPGCQDQPFDSPFTWFSADVVVDGQSFTDVGVRKKGFLGSLDPVRPSLKVKFDEFWDGPYFLDMRRLTLNNSRQDPSYVRQCLAYQLFTAAGVPAPRCNFAHVVVNGEDMGVYTNIEAVKKPMLRRHFDDDDGELYEGTLSDFRPGWIDTFEQKTNESAPTTEKQDAIAAVLAGPDDMLESGLAPHLDLDEFMTFWAMEVLTGHWDGYTGNTNNFFLYTDPTDDRVHFLPWGTDGTFIAPLLFFEGQQAPSSVFATGLLARRLYLYGPTRDQYLAKLTSLLDAHWDEDALQAEIDRMSTLFAPYLRPGELGAHADALAATRNYVDQRRDAIAYELDPYVDWTVPLRDELCLAQSGDLFGTFSTTWGSHPTNDYFGAGSGTFAGTYLDVPLTVTAVGAGAGLNPNVPDGTRSQLVLPAITDELGTVLLVVDLDTALLDDAAALSIDGGAVSATLYTFNGAIEYLASVYDGTLSITSGPPGDGQPFVGSWSAMTVTF